MAFLLMERMNGTAGFGRNEKTIRALSDEEAKAYLTEDKVTNQDGATVTFVRPVGTVNVTKATDMVDTVKVKVSRKAPNASATTEPKPKDGMMLIRGIPTNDEKRVLIPLLEGMGDERVEWVWKTPVASLTLSEDGLNLWEIGKPGKRPTTVDGAIAYVNALFAIVEVMSKKGTNLPDWATKVPPHAQRILRDIMRQTFAKIKGEAEAYHHWVASNRQRVAMGLAPNPMPGQESEGAVLPARAVAHELRTMLEKAKSEKSDEEKLADKRKKNNTLLARETPYHRAAEVKGAFAKVGCKSEQKCRDDSSGSSQNWMRKNK